jgi:hypothetical protein
LTIFEPSLKNRADGKTSNVEVEVYNCGQKGLWDSFVSNAKNGVFLFFRDYLEYHSDRFVDHSLLFFKDDEPVALLPANVSDNILCSHGGLTFGGVVSGISMSQPLMLEIFNKLIEHCQTEDINQIMYKPTPHIYHSFPAEEDLYALYRNNAKLFSRNVSSTIYLPEKKGTKTLKKKNHQKSA